MSNFNYCYDECEFNTGARHYWEETGENGKKIVREKSDEANKKLQCLLGYRQTVNSHSAYVNSLKNNTRVCLRLRKLFGQP